VATFSLQFKARPAGTQDGPQSSPSVGLIPAIQGT